MRRDLTTHRAPIGAAVVHRPLYGADGGRQAPGMSIHQRPSLGSSLTPVTKLIVAIAAIVLILALTGLAFVIHEIDMFILEHRASSSAIEVRSG